MTSPATATSTWPSPTATADTVSVLLGNGDGTFQPQVTYAVGIGPGRDRGGGLHRRRPPRPGRRQRQLTTRLGAAGQRRRHVPAPGHLRGRGRTRLPSWRGTSPATATSTSPSPTTQSDARVGAAGQRRRHLPTTVRNQERGRGRTQTPSWRGTSPATAGSTWPSPTTSSNDVSVLLGNGDGTFQPQVTYAVGIVPGRHRGGGLQRRRPARPGRRQRTHRGDRVGAAGQRRRHVPAPGHLRGGVGPGLPSWRGLHRRRPPRPGRRQRLGGPTRCRCCWATATAPSSPRSPTRSGSHPDAIVAGDFTGDGHLDLAVANYDSSDRRTVSRAAGQRRRHVPAPGHLRGRVGPGRDRGGGLHRRRPPRPGRRQRHPIDGHDVSVLLGNGDGTFQPQVTYAVGSAQTPSWRGTSPATASSTWPSRTTTVQRRLGAAGQRRRHVPAPGHLRGRVGSRTPSWRATSTATASSTWPSPTTRSNDVSVLLGNGDGTFVGPRPVRHHPHATPLVADVTGDGTDDVLVVDGAGNILYRQGIPGQPGTFEPPVTVNPGDGSNPSRATSPGCRTPIKAPSSPASTPRTTPSRFTLTATAVSSG